VQFVLDEKRQYSCSITADNNVQAGFSFKERRRSGIAYPKQQEDTMSVKNALARLTEVKTKKSVRAVLGDTSPDAIGKSFFRLFALSFS
jgi:hypothetical protein